MSDIVQLETLAGQNNQVYFKCLKDAISKSDTIDRPIFMSSAHALGLDFILKENQGEINSLFSSKTNLENVRINAKRLGRLQIARTSREKLRTAISEIEKVSGDESPSTILSIVEKPGFDIQRLLNSSNEEGGLLCRNAISYIEKLIANPDREIGIPTGYPTYDKIIGGGIRRGGFALMGARRKIGKSSLAVCTALLLAKGLKIPVLYLDTEMQCDEHLSRVLANQTGIPVNTIEHARFVNNAMFTKELKDTAKSIEKYPITHQRIGGKDFDEVLSIMRRWLMKEVGYHESGQFNNCLIIYDYFKLSDSSQLKNLKEYEAMGYQAVRLSQFLVEMNVPCWAFVQLSRDGEIAQSDRLSWNATSVCLFTEKTPDEIVNDGYENGNRKIIYDVSRFGGGLPKDDYINVEFNGELCQIKEIGIASEAAQEKSIGKSGYRIKDATEQDLEDAPF